MRVLQGVKIFSEILNFFERWNSWGGWGIFIGMFILNVTLFLPSVALILGAGFIFGCAPISALANPRTKAKAKGVHGAAA
jgi:membrane protein DedA with SNARE-associated domain